MPRLLIVTTVPAAIRAFLLPHVTYLRARGWEVHGAAKEITKDEECCAVLDQVWDIDWSRRPSDLLNITSAPRQIRQVVREQQFDIVHVHTPIASAVTRYALRGARRAGKPKVIYTAHGFHFHAEGSAWRNGIFSSLERVAGRWTDFLVVINREDEEAANRLGIVPHSCIRYMPGIGVDRERYSAESVTEASVREFRSAIGVGDAPLIATIAEFNPGKRHRDLLHAFAQLPSAAHLALAGTGNLVEQTRALSRKLGIADRVHFLGFCRNISTLIKASVMTVLPSEREGLPRSVMESLCLGVPVVGTDVRGVRELIEDGAGICVQVGDVDALAAGMKMLLNSPELTRQMGERGRIRMKHYDVRQVVQLHEQLYEEALGSVHVNDAALQKVH